MKVELTCPWGHGCWHLLLSYTPTRSYRCQVHSYNLLPLSQSVWKDLEISYPFAAPHPPCAPAQRPPWGRCHAECQMAVGSCVVVASPFSKAKLLCLTLTEFCRSLDGAFCRVAGTHLPLFNKLWSMGRKGSPWPLWMCLAVPPGRSDQICTLPFLAFRVS